MLYVTDVVPLETESLCESEGKSSGEDGEKWVILSFSY